MLSIRSIKLFSLILAIIFAIGTLVACAQSETTPSLSNKLTLFVAAGLKNPMDVVIEGFKKEKNTEITVNYVASGACYTQIKAGQPCDLYFSADWIYIDKVKQDNLLDTSYKFLIDNVVLIVSKSATSKVTSATDLVKSGITVVLADTQAPVGIYSENALKKLGIWEQLSTSGNIKARPTTVNQVAIMVKEDQIDAGMVFSSVARANGLEPVQVFGTDLTGEIIFGAAVIKNGNVQLAKDFYNYAYNHVSEFTKYGWQLYK